MAATVLPAAAADGLLGKPTFRIAPAAWLASLDGEWSLGQNGSAGDTVTAQELDADDATLGGMIEGSIGLPWILDIEFGGFIFANDGESTLNRNISFGNSTFTISERVESESTLIDAYAGVSFSVLDTPAGWLSVGVVGHLLNGEVTMTSATKDETIDDSVPVPALTARGAFSVIPSLTIGAAAQWMSLTVADADVDLIDLQGYIEWKPVPAVGVIAGYRLFDVAVDIEDDDEPSSIDAKIAGPFAGIVVSL